MTAADKRLVLAHLWPSFLLFVCALILGFWQFWFRSPIPPGFGTPTGYYAALTAHGTIIGYAFTTFFAMGFGYAITALSTGAALRWRNGAWSALALASIGLALSLFAIGTGRASVLYTFYPPLMAPFTFYLGLTLLVVGSWYWVAHTIVSFYAWKRANPGRTTPLGLYMVTAMALLWLWTSIGAALELLFQLIPLSLGWIERIDLGLARTLFSWTLHGIVYFWLLPAYIALYVIVPEQAGGRLYSDLMGRLTFVLFIVFGLPVGLHHLFMDPEHGIAFKFVQGVLTVFVAVPTLLTVFTVAASLEIAGRLRGGRGSLGWLRTLPWQRPAILATGLAAIMLGLGGLGGLINMSYALNAAVHNTAWVTAHFHLIFGGAVVILYFAIAYQLWPVLAGRPLSASAACVQLVTWCVGMLALTLPWHVTGIMGQPRRMAFFDYSDPVLAPTAWLTTLSLVGGALVLASAFHFLWILSRAQLGATHRSEIAFRFARPAVRDEHVPSALNGFALWNWLTAGAMAAAYGWPIVQFFIYPSPGAAGLLAGGPQ